MADEKAVSSAVRGEGRDGMTSGASAPARVAEIITVDAAPLAQTESPPLSPDTNSAAPEVTVDGPSVSAPEIQATATSATPEFATDAVSTAPKWPLKWLPLNRPSSLPSLSRRARRRGAIAATIAAAACLGATIG